MVYIHSCLPNWRYKIWTLGVKSESHYLKNIYSVFCFVLFLYHQLSPNLTIIMHFWEFPAVSPLETSPPSKWVSDWNVCNSPWGLVNMQILVQGLGMGLCHLHFRQAFSWCWDGWNLDYSLRSMAISYSMEMSTKGHHWHHCLNWNSNQYPSWQWKVACSPMLWPQDVTWN